VKFSVEGEIVDSNGNPISNLNIQAMDSDQGFFEDHNDDLLESTKTNERGLFEITFEDSSFKDRWLEGQPEVYLIVRNVTGQIIHRTETIDLDKPVRITIDTSQKITELLNIDPYANNVNRVLSAFGSLSDVTTFRTSDFERNLRLLLSSVSAWANYTNEIAWKKIGYDGPQVPRYPFRSPGHSHKLSWEK
jgi:hypothetical protein